ncbi:MAG: ABC transporter ATP-binding protein [Spirochaetota bacterium]
MADVRLQGVTKRFGAVTAIRSLDLEIASGEFFVLLGPTGAGKTTTLRCIAGLERQEEGDIFIDGKKVNKVDPAHRDVAFVFQYYSLYPHFTVRENLELPLKPRMRATPREEIDRRVAEAARILHISHLLDRKSEKLSGGEMQRVTIGRAIVRNPKVFLMDEPLSNLDAKLREELRAELKRLQIDLGATLFFVTHDQVEAMTMADRIGVLNNGRILQLGTPGEIYNHPASTFVASFVGSPAINLFASRVENDRLVLVPGAFEYTLDSKVLDRIGGRQGEVISGVRPEDFVVHGRPGGGCAAQVYNIENMGMEKIVTLKIDTYIFKAVTAADFEAGINSRVSVDVKQERVHFFDPETGKNLA